jgi:transposase
MRSSNAGSSILSLRSSLKSYAPGAVVSEVARQNDISAQHVFAWRKAARAGLLFSVSVLKRFD